MKIHLHLNALIIQLVSDKAKKLSFVALLFALSLSSHLAEAQREVNVDHFTGTASISIPLYTLQSKGVAIPIGLTYTASGVKVADPGGLVGTGWNLQAGYSITREIRGLADDIIQNTTSEKRYGWLTNGVDIQTKVAAVPVALPSSYTCTPTEVSARTALAQFNTTTGPAATAIHTIYDSESDIYSYSLPGHTGRFVFDAQKNIKTIPYDPITITFKQHAPGSWSSSFEIRTPEGHIYEFNTQDLVNITAVEQTSVPRVYRREYDAYNKIPHTQLCSAWHLTRIITPRTGSQQQNTVSFSYDEEVIGEATRQAPSLYWVNANTSSALSEEYTLKVSSTTKNWLSTIRTATGHLDFSFSPVPYGADHSKVLQSINIYALGDKVPEERFIRRVQLEYDAIASTEDNWHNTIGVVTTQNAIRNRPFLKQVKILNDCATLASYQFKYDGLAFNPAPGSVYTGTTTLPPMDCVEQDYWGYYNGNNATSLIPQLYVYPKDPAVLANAKPGAPYRLFPTPSLNDGTEFILTGADRSAKQTDAGFQETTAAGTLTEMTVPTGGRVFFQYESHRFWDPEAQTYRNGGGVRIKNIRTKDNITGVEQTRHFEYGQSTTTESSGRLLHVPRFAFTNALSSLYVGTIQERNTAAAVRSGEDLATDPFENRTVGYARVLERMAGRGLTIYTFSLPALPESPVAAGYSQTYTGMGVGEYDSSLGYKCASAGYYAPGVDIYPFAPLRNYGHERGKLLTVLQQAETATSGVYKTVSLETYDYGYKTVAGGAQEVTGVAYEQLKTGEGGIFAYAKYSLQTNFLYALSRKTTIRYDQQRATQGIATVISYGYNSLGQLASVVQQNSDNSYQRIRYKYLVDFISGNEGVTGPNLTALRHRFTQDKITHDLVETITEVKPAGATVPLVTGVAVNTYAIQDGKSHPYRFYAWQPASPAANNNLTTFDSTRVGASDWVPNGKARLISTIEKVSPDLLPTDTYTVAGRKRNAVHFNADETAPRLIVDNATASEVLFSDFEGSSSQDFIYSADAVTASIARTGNRSLHLPVGAYVAHALPVSDAPLYRFSFWTYNQSTSASVTVSILVGTTTLTRTAAPGSMWQLHEVELNVGSLSSPRSSHEVKLSANAPLYLDDVLLLPATAIVGSMTQDIVFGKTSETDQRHQTTFYEYDPAGNEAQIRNHNRDLIRQVTTVTAGQRPAVTVDFEVSGNLWESYPVQFVAKGGCLPNAQYSWTFVEGTNTETVTPSARTSTAHIFSTGGTSKTFTVTLTITSQGQQFSKTKTVLIEAGPLLVGLCVSGATSYNGCTNSYRYESCDGSTPVPGSGPRETTTFEVTIANLTDGCTNTTYQWQRTDNAQQTYSWSDVGNSSTSSTLTLDAASSGQSYSVRCIVRHCGREATTGTLTYYVNTTGNDGRQCPM